MSREKLDDTAKTFSGRLRSVRESRGYTQASAAEAIGAEPAQWSNWERGVATPYLKMLGPIGDLLEVSIHWLVLGEGPRDVISLRVVEAASRHGTSPVAIAEAFEAMSADALQAIVDRKRAEEAKAWNGPIHEAIAALEEALKENPPLMVRDEITRTLERMRQRLSGDDGESATPPPLPRLPGNA